MECRPSRTSPRKKNVGSLPDTMATAEPPVDAVPPNGIELAPQGENAAFDQGDMDALSELGEEDEIFGVCRVPRSLLTQNRTRRRRAARKASLGSRGFARLQVISTLQRSRRNLLETILT